MTEAAPLDLRVAPPVTVGVQVAEKLRHAILSGHFRPGQRLVESELCRAMGVSRSSLREAVRQLAGERLVEIVPNRGPAVAEIGWEEAAQIYHARALLEGEAAALAAAAGAAEPLARMRAAIKGFDAAMRDGDPIARLSTTTQFYESLMAACGNTVMAELHAGLLARVNFLRARSMSRPGRARHSAAEMRAILLAVAAGDAGAARAAAVAHVRAAAEAAREAMRAIIEEAA